MIVVEMCDQHVVDLVDFGVLCGGYDAVSIAPVVTWPARVDQQRLAGRRNKQCRLPAFHVHKVHFQLLGSWHSQRGGSHRSYGEACAQQNAHRGAYEFSLPLLALEAKTEQKCCHVEAS